MIHGIGIDIVDVVRFKKALLRWGDRLSSRLFTRPEIDYCFSHKRPERHLAARFAGKVSLIKALGKPLSFKDIEITRDNDGRPSIKAAGIEGLVFNLSITHDGDLSIAETIIEKAG
ncbi:MAG: holo-ACP synthase [Deltaproteobacteria bacterium]|nr:holo-ACP synthase [Deltaproteobacteria bacterium]